jgi:hypothetical protein
VDRLSKCVERLCEELNIKIQGTQLDIYMTEMPVEATQWKFKTQLADIEA